LAATVEQVKITGLRDFQAALRTMDGETQKQLRLVLNKAADLVVVGARRRVPTRTGAAQSSIRAGSTQREASVKAGSRRAPYYPWLDFGGRVGRGRSISRRFQAGGRYVYPAYDEVRPKVQDILEAELAALARSAGLAVT
jgi:hypothetical protein